MKTLFYTLLILTIIVSATALVHAQPPPLPFKPDQAPIDGGLGLLAAAGGAYAWRKLRAKKG